MSRPSLYAIVLTLLSPIVSDGFSPTIFWERRSIPATCLAASTSNTNSQKVSSYLEFLGIVPPKRLDPLLRVLTLQGLELVLPCSRYNIAPLVIPLAKGSDGSIVGLLRSPTAKRSDELPVVRGYDSDSKPTLSMLAPNTATYIMRAAAESDFYTSSGCDEIIEVANEGIPYEKQYEPGSVKNFNKGLERYLLLRVAAFPDTYTSLALEHRDIRNDIQSALITAEKACAVFDDWASSYAFSARLLQSVPGYDLEARDAARTALSKPLWTLGCDDTEFRKLVLLAGKEDVDEFVRDYKRMVDSDINSREISPSNITPEQAAFDRAARVLDLVVCDTFAAEGNPTYDWNAKRDMLAELYRKSGSTALERLVSGIFEQEDENKGE